MIQGLRTVVYPVPDLAAARDWYAAVVGHGPYFDEPFYVGFEVGGFELGLRPDGDPGTSGSTAYWGVADIDAAAATLTGHGATPVDGVQDVGGGIKVAEFRDPFGNTFAVIENPHFDAAKVR